MSKRTKRCCGATNLHHVDVKPVRRILGCESGLRFIHWSDKESVVLGRSEKLRKEKEQVREMIKGKSRESSERKAVGLGSATGGEWRHAQRKRERNANQVMRS